MVTPLDVASLKRFDTAFCPMRHKIAQPSAYDHGCVQRRHRISTLAGFLLPMARTYPGHARAQERGHLLPPHSTQVG